jgi:hypothetical protein
MQVADCLEIFQTLERMQTTVHKNTVALPSVQQWDGTAVGRTCGGSLLVEALGVSSFPEPDQVAHF